MTGGPASPQGGARNTDRPADAAAPDRPTSGDRAAADDPSIVPGLEASTGALDMSQDPDRFDPTHQPVVVGPLDMSQDPDRMPRPGEGQSLTDLLGKERSYEEDRDGYEWIYGLLSVLAFLALVAYIFNNVLAP